MQQLVFEVWNLKLVPCLAFGLLKEVEGERLIIRLIQFQFPSVFPPQPSEALLCSSLLQLEAEVTVSGKDQAGSHSVLPISSYEADDSCKNKDCVSELTLFIHSPSFILLPFLPFMFISFSTVTVCFCFIIRPLT